MDIMQENLQKAYDFLATCPPFSTWNLPDSDEVKFKVMRARDRYGDYHLNDKRQHVIRISARHVTSVRALMATMAHEMIHLHEKESGIERRSQRSEAFKLLAAKVCEVCGFHVDGF